MKNKKKWKKTKTRHNEWKTDKSINKLHWLAKLQVDPDVYIVHHKTKATTKKKRKMKNKKTKETQK